jgi:hypothetical protein
MSLVSLTLAKKHLRVWHTDDDTEIGVYLGAAEEAVARYLGRAIYGSEDDSPAGAPPTGDDGTAIEITPAITTAILLLTADFYETREPDPKLEGNAVLPRAVRSLLAPYRVWRTEAEDTETESE